MSNKIKREKPKRCPFCGGTDLKLTYTMIEGAKVHYVLCYECGAHGGIAMTEDFALTKWNTRRDEEKTRMFGFYDGVSKALNEAEKDFAKELDEIETEVKGLMWKEPENFFGISLNALSKGRHKNEAFQEVLDIIKKHRDGEEE